MKRLLPFIAFLFASLGITAQNEALFNSATTAYNAGNYDEAIENYLKIVDNGQHSSSLYFNMGNAYYKLNQIAPSIYYYEKALLLKPNDPDILNNLAYANNMTLDAIEPMPQNALSKFYAQAVAGFSCDEWAYLSIGFMILFVLFYIVFYFFQVALYKRVLFIGAILALFSSIMAVMFAYITHNEYKADQPAIVFAKQVAIKSEPNERGQVVFNLHEGTKVKVEESLDNWKKIRIIDGQTGWLPSEHLKMLKDF